ncbi:hypothetical protein [Polaribacter sp.]|uniref:hypothetical protein n=1 Tax=Polaribacter sp. TaxID=1920175 RepID=UPI003EF9D435
MIDETENTLEIPKGFIGKLIQFFGEVIDIKDISGLFLVYPFAFKGKLIQYIGRVQRSELTPIIYDYRDKQISYLNKLFLKRNTYYRNLDRQATLFDDLNETTELNSKKSSGYR